MDFYPPVGRGDEQIPGYRLVFSDDFDGTTLDTGRWFPHHLPHWSSRARSAASYRLRDGSLSLFVGEEQGSWCPEFDGDVKVSALQTGAFAGELGSGIGQHRFNEQVRVRELQPVLRLYTPLYGRIVLRARARMAPTSLVSLYLVGFEERPEDAGEITVMEVFGNEVFPDGALIGHGIKPINDSRLEAEFFKPKLSIRMFDWHVYAADWTPEGVRFLLDDELIGIARQSPPYPMQLMLTFYQLPLSDATRHDPDACFEIDYVRGYERQ